MNITQINRDEWVYPESMVSFLGSYAPRTIWAHGNLEFFVAHVAEDGKIEVFCWELATRGKSLTTLETGANANLIALGARPLNFEA